MRWLEREDETKNDVDDLYIPWNKGSVFILAITKLNGLFTNVLYATKNEPGYIS